MTRSGREQFGMMIVNESWEQVLDCVDPSTAVEKLNYILENTLNSSFPVKTYTRKSSDAVWLSKKLRKLSRRKKVLYKLGGKYDRWKELDQVSKIETKNCKVKYLDNIESDVKSSGTSAPFFRGVRMLKAKDAPTQWNIKSLFPGQTPENIAEQAAEYFSRISQEYDPVPALPTDDKFRRLEQYEVAAKLRHMKKPKSQVPGDLHPSLVTEFADILSIPLVHIYNRIISTNDWPRQWKNESVTLIPKTPIPTALSELRNLSCTPFFSKVMESFLLDQLRTEISLSREQYGGVKGVSATHFTIAVLQETIQALETPNTVVNLMSVDYEKAFNRMDHTKCLEALKQLGTTQGPLNLVNAFLFQRTMQVKVDNARSDLWFIPGGAPQGSILANFLFCATTDRLGKITSQLQDPAGQTASFDDNGISAEHDPDRSFSATSPTIARPTPTKQEYRNTPATSTPATRGQFETFAPRGNLDRELDASFSSGDDSFHFLHIRRLGQFSDSSSSDSDRAQSTRPPTATTTALRNMTRVVYVDDCNVTEHLDIDTGRRHITGRKENNDQNTSNRMSRKILRN